MNRDSKIALEIDATPGLCYAMQQSAVPWLNGVRLHNRGTVTIRDVTVTVTLEPPFAAPLEWRIAEVAAGGSAELERPDPRLELAELANLLERVRGELRAVAVDESGAVVADTGVDLEILAFNEWPGLAVLPQLLAAFVLPNHPALLPVLHAVSERLAQATGTGALDGYQSREASRADAIVTAVYDALAACNIRYVSAPPSFERTGQKIRTPEQVLGDRLGTCLDLALLMAAVLEHVGLHPFVILERSHAYVGVWLVEQSQPEAIYADAIEVRKFCDAGALTVVEATGICESGRASLEASERSARGRLDDEPAFQVAVDVAASRRQGIAPLPPRVRAYAPGEAVDPQGERDEALASLPRRPSSAVSPSGEAVTGDSGAADPEVGEPLPEPAPSRGPKDRLEHWKSKLLDLTMFNRLLNFRETRKTIRLCEHDLEALEDRLQQRGRLRIHPRPQVGQGGDPRDLELEEQRTGVDVVEQFLAEELRSGRLRADHEEEDLEARLVEIFRHARTSLEESGANTLYLAVGFLRWFETPQSTKERRAPLLLLPLVIERTSVREGFRLVLDDAEPRINQTLLQMLERDFELRVDIDAVPEDDLGVDVGAVLDAFRAAALGMPRWEVESGAQVGFFSFTKYLMWLDLADREALMRAPVLNHLVESPGLTFAQEVPELPRDELDDLDPVDVYCPKDADSSQLAAVLAGAQGRTFVLEGPPGTGKSQTITNLIAQALANEKRVLFVAEKRAALEVVQRRLDSVGLGAFCLELHSSKSGSKAVLEQLRRPLELEQRREPRDWQAIARELQSERHRLNRYVRAIHQRRDHGLSLFAAIGRLVDLRDAQRVPMPELLRGAPDDVATARRAVEELAGAAQRLDVPVREVWWGVRRTDWSPALLRDIVPAAERLQRATEAYGGAVRRTLAAFGIEARIGEAGASRDQGELLLQLADLFSRSRLPPSTLVLHESWRRADEALAALVAIGRDRNKLWQPLAERWQRELLTLDLDRLAAAYRQSAESFFLIRWWKLRGPKRELQAVAAAGVPVADPRAVRDDLGRALAVRGEERRLFQGDPEVVRLLGAAWNGGLADWNRIDAWLSWVRDVRQIVMQMFPGSLQPDAEFLAGIGRQLDGLAEGADVLPGKLGALRTAHDEYRAALDVVRSMLELDVDAAFGSGDAAGLAGLIDARLRRWLHDVPRLREQCAYARAATEAADHGAAPLVAAHAGGELATDQLQATFERTFLEAWLDGIHAAHPELAMFRGADHERSIREFRELDQRAIRTAAQVIVARLLARLPRVRDTQAASSELGILERELKKQRRHKPVRRLIAEIPGLLSRLAPCVLMSPLSVAQFLGRSDTRFDLVVFDEASQIPMWDAVGAIGRGDSLVVVGDSRQLPPTSFFQRLEQGDDDDTDDLPDDLESVLDECSAAGLPRMYLDWHYRSRHESLIAFSNHHYYSNRLLTFPAPAEKAAGLGVRFVAVDGIYDRGGSQQNKVEAEALVAEVLARLADPAQAERTIGIVTFSRSQQVLIEDLLDRARGENPALEPFFTAVEEPVFVKNLENVQGDERDTILFSICYGPDAAGKIYENYGPLNQQGGERRLNVAVTRARRELVVFSSLRADQVATRTAAVGARHLRAFLDYAERGEAALAAAVAADPSGDVESPFEAAVRDELVRRGHEVHPQVGCSGYRIDLCVVDPEAPGRYLLGIECDGATYHGAATARDRDRIRAAVLRGLGWHLHRVWSMDFWQDPVGEIERLEIAIAEAKQRVAWAAQEAVVADRAVPEVDDDGSREAAAFDLADAEAEAGEGDSPAPEAEPGAQGGDRPGPENGREADPNGPRPYAVADLRPARKDADFYAPKNSRQVRAHVEEVLAVEAPIAFDRLTKTVATAWDVSRVTEKVRSRIRESLPAAVVEQAGVVHATAELAKTFRGFRVPEAENVNERPAEDLPAVEVKNAMAWLLEQHHALSAEDLAREAARCFGIHRLGSVVRGVMESGLEDLVAAGLAERDGDNVRLP
ncbi:MAG: DUF3320 domain-containing protein [bacterium]|nr:DUF3320 domain-containing protein [bacterium]